MTAKRSMEDKMRGRMARTSPIARKAGEGTPSAAGGERLGGKRVRITVDLEADEHRALRRVAFEEETDGTKVVRALLAQLREGPLSAQLLEAVRRFGQ